MIRLTDVHKTYRGQMKEVAALQGVTFEVAAGRFVSIMGPSGSGKSTLLNLLGALAQPTSGEIRIDNRAVHLMNDEERTFLRRERLAFIFQFFNLLPTMTALENVCLPAFLAGRNRDEVRSRAGELLDVVGLGPRAEHRPHELSGGEMQRVAIARGLIMNPPVLLADEPTGNLDSTSGREILDLLRTTSKELGRTLVMVTHDPRAADYADGIIELQDGKVTSIHDTGVAGA